MKWSININGMLTRIGFLRQEVRELGSLKESIDIFLWSCFLKVTDNNPS